MKPLAPALVAALLLSSASRAVEDAAAWRLRTGRELFEGGHYGRALDEFLEVLKVSPENLEAKTYITRIGESWRRLEIKASLTRRERGEALAEVAQLMDRRQSRLSEVYRELDAVRRHLEAGALTPQRFIAASYSLARVKDADVSDRVFLDQSAQYVRLLQEKLDAAVGRGGAFQSHKDAMAARGFLAYYRGNHELALKEWKKALALTPEDSMLKEQIEVVSRQKALKEREETVRALEARAFMLREKGDDEQALLNWKSLVILVPDNKDYQRSLVETQDRLRKRKAKALVAQARIAQQKGRSAQASQLYLEALEADPSNRAALASLKIIQEELLGRLAASAKTPLKSAAAVKTGSSAGSSPAQSEERYTVGLIYYSQGDQVKAREELARAVSLDPGNLKAKNALERISAESAP